MSKDIKWYKGMRPTDRYRVKTRCELLNLVKGNPAYHDRADRDILCSNYFDKGFYRFTSNMFKYLGHEINPSPPTSALFPGWFCEDASKNCLWLLEWLEPIIETTVEDIDE